MSGAETLKQAAGLVLLGMYYRDYRVYFYGTKYTFYAVHILYRSQHTFTGMLNSKDTRSKGQIINKSYIYNTKFISVKHSTFLM